MRKNKKTCQEEECNYPIYSTKRCRYHYQIYLNEKRASKPLKKESGTRLSKPKKKRSYKRIDYQNTTLEYLSTLKNGDLKKIADYQLRQHLLRKVERNGNNQIKCFITGKYYNESDLHTAHFVPRIKLCTRFDLENCHLVNKWSNTFDDQVYNDSYPKGVSKHIFEYGEALIGYYGGGIIDRLKKKSKEVCRFSKDDYIALIQKLII